MDKTELTELCKDKCYFIQKVLIDNEYLIILIKEIDYGIQIKTESGVVINVYSTGKILLQGKEDNFLLNKLIKL